jgi:MFS family permease
MNRKAWIIIIVASLGYFVDIYDLVLFNIVKKESLDALGFSLAETKLHEISLFNYQMIGMLIGGILWGTLGDKKGRVVVLFGSILIYSTANFLNAFVENLVQYKILRFIAGIGLAGELGAGITLVSETLDQKKRGLGTMIIVTFGALGAVVAALVGNKGYYINGIFGWNFQNWQIAYIIGGAMGFLLLILRTSNLESHLFKENKNKEIKKGDLWMLLNDRKILKKFIYCTLIGIPIWYIVGTLSSLANRFALANSQIEISVADCIMWTYLGLSVGDLISGLLSQFLKSRKKVINIYLVLSFFLVCIYLLDKNQNSSFYYLMNFLLGCGTGYWALFVINGAEQFGTNFRATASTMIPNIVRGSVVPISIAFQYLSHLYNNEVYGALTVGVFCFLLAFYGNYKIKDGFKNDLNFNH